MSQSAWNDRPLKLVVAQELREVNADAGLAEIVANRVIVEQAKGMLMLIYELDADNAFEMLKWGSQARDVELGLLARQLIDDLAGGAQDWEGLARCEWTDLRSACDDLLFTAQEPSRPVHRPGPQP